MLNEPTNCFRGRWKSSRWHLRNKSDEAEIPQSLRGGLVSKRGAQPPSLHCMIRCACLKLHWAVSLHAANCPAIVWACAIEASKRCDRLFQPRLWHLLKLDFRPPSGREREQLGGTSSDLFDHVPNYMYLRRSVPPSSGLALVDLICRLYPAG
jgi:hypothetical protein